MSGDGPRAVAPPGLAAPAAAYAHAVTVTGPGRWLHTSGIVPTAPDGTVPASVAEQAARIWSTITALLAHAGMGVADVVAVTTYVVVDRVPELPAVMSARDRALDGHLAASTLVTVPALAQPAWLVEIAVVAFRPV